MTLDGFHRIGSVQVLYSPHFTHDFSEERFVTVMVCVESFVLASVVLLLAVLDYLECS